MGQCIRKRGTTTTCNNSDHVPVAISVRAGVPLEDQADARFHNRMKVLINRKKREVLTPPDLFGELATLVVVERPSICQDSHLTGSQEPARGHRCGWLQGVP